MKREGAAAFWVRCSEFLGSGGLDTLAGRAGNDTYDLTAPLGGGIVVEDAGEGIDTIVVSVSYTLPANVENLTLPAPGGGYGIGNELDNVILGSSGINQLNGLGGADQLVGGGVTDFLYFDALDSVVNGGGDYDYAFAQGPAGVTINPVTRNLENVQGNDGNDVLNAAGANYAVVLNGMGGADQLTGGLGDDTLAFDAVDTVVQGGAGLDFAWAITDTAGVTVNLLAQGIEIAWGGSGGDTLSAGEGDDTILGGFGNDIGFSEGGTDIARFELDRAFYTWTDHGGGVVTVAGLGFTDTLYHVEVLRFDAGAESSCSASEGAHTNGRAEGARLDLHV
jgi:Ca2+-binding RTX toxin-like protein